MSPLSRKARREDNVHGFMVVQDNLDAIAKRGGMGVACALSANEPTVSGVTEILNWTGNDYFDYGALHNPVSNPDKIIAPSGAGGLWLVGFDIEWGVTSTLGVRYQRIYHKRVDGTTKRYVTRRIVGSSGESEGTPVSLFSPIGGEYFQAEVYQDSGVAVSVIAAGSSFWAVKVG